MIAEKKITVAGYTIVGGVLGYGTGRIARLSDSSFAEAIFVGAALGLGLGLITQFKSSSTVKTVENGTEVIVQSGAINSEWSGLSKVFGAVVAAKYIVPVVIFGVTYITVLRNTSVLR